MATSFRTRRDGVGATDEFADGPTIVGGHARPRRTILRRVDFVTEPHPADDPGRRDDPGPIGGNMANVLAGLARRASLPSLVTRHDSTAVLGLFAFVNGVISIGLMAAAAFVTRSPLLIPSLGPTAFLLFYTPKAASACPRNTMIGHGIGAGAGFVSLAVFGLLHQAPALAGGFTTGRIGATALSLGLTSGLMVWLKVPHPPAGATTLIVSLGILHEPWHIGVLMLAVFLLVTQGIVINRLAGIDYPLWGPRPAATAVGGPS